MRSARSFGFRLILAFRSRLADTHLCSPYSIAPSKMIPNCSMARPLEFFRIETENVHTVVIIDNP